MGKSLQDSGFSPDQWHGWAVILHLGIETWICYLVDLLADLYDICSVSWCSVRVRPGEIIR